MLFQEYFEKILINIYASRGKRRTELENLPKVQKVLVARKNGILKVCI